MVNKILNVSLVPKMLRELSLYYISSKNEYAWVFDKYNDIWEQVSNIFKKTKIENLYIIKTLKAEKIGRLSLYL